MQNKTTLIYLTGKPGVGKYTIAQQLAEKQSFIICDNQLINNPIFELLQYDGYGEIPSIGWNAIAKMRTAIFEFLKNHQHNSYVLTNCLAEKVEDRDLYEQVREIAEVRGSIFIPVTLMITKEEHLNRLTQPARRIRWKSVDPIDAEDHGPLLSIVHPNFLELEVSNLTAEDAALAIIAHINQVRL
jgi:hypothetical protein